MPKKSIRLLVVDDEPDICKFIKLLFKKEGFLVYSALNGLSAVKLAKKIKPQVALLDIYLKGKQSGIDTLRQIRESLPLCKNIMVTWDSAKEKMKEAKAAGAVSYLLKPLTTDSLIKVVNRVAKGLRRRA